MDYLLIGIGFICVVIGLIGSVIPILPGPPISWIGILLLYLTKAIDFNYWILFISLLLAIFSVILDYVVPAMGIKKFQGSKAGIYGSYVGAIIGLFTPFFLGFLIGLFLGAFVGELIHDSKNINRALKAAVGAFIGFVLSTFMNFILALVLLVLFLAILWTNSEKFI